MNNEIKDVLMKEMAKMEKYSLTRTEILDLLQNTKMSCNQIAKCFNIDLQTVYIINNGQAKRYRRDGFTYPARPHN